MKKKMLRRLTLSRETIRHLDESTLHELAGGVEQSSYYPVCECTNVTRPTPEHQRGTGPKQH